MFATALPSDIPARAVLTRLALLVFAVYTVINSIRFNSQTQPDVENMLYQALFNGAQGHAGAMSALQEVWVGNKARRRLHSELPHG